MLLCKVFRVATFVLFTTHILGGKGEFMNAEEIIQQVERDAHALMEKHHISYETGFLAPRNTDYFLPRDFVDLERNAYFLRLEHATRMLPELTRNRGVVRAVEALEVPSWSFNDLSRENQYMLMLELTMLAHAAFHEQLGYQTVRDLYTDESEKYLWPQLAKPIWELSQITGIDPTMAYWLYGKWNKCLKDPRGPHTPDNLEPLFTFTGGETEKWFVAVHHAAEAKLALGVPSQLKAYLLSQYSSEVPIKYLRLYLWTSAIAILNAVGELKRMREHLDPFTYFEQVRMFYAWPRNVVYVGVVELGGVGQNYDGETGGGSAAHHLGDAMTGVEHRDESKIYIQARRRQMPRDVRELLDEVEQNSRVRELVLAHRANDELVMDFNMNLFAKLDWRMEHRGLVLESISQYGDSRGTANPALTLIDNMIEDTRASLLH